MNTNFFPAGDAMLSDDIATDSGVLPVNAEFFRPFLSLRQRIDQIDELVAWLPIDTDIFLGCLVEHQQASGLCAIFQSPLAQLPWRNFQSDVDATICGTLTISPDLAVARQILGERVAPNASGKPGTNSYPKMMRMIDAFPPPWKR
jgi:hypothetical protein